MHDARITIAGEPALNPRKTELRDGKLVLLLKPWSDEAKIMEAWFKIARTPGEDFRRNVLVEFSERKRFRLLKAYPSVRRNVEDGIGRERIEYVIFYGELEKIP